MLRKAIVITILLMAFGMVSNAKAEKFLFQFLGEGEKTPVSVAKTGYKEQPKELVCLPSPKDCGINLLWEIDGSLLASRDEKGSCSAGLERSFMIDLTNEVGSFVVDETGQRIGQLVGYEYEGYNKYYGHFYEMPKELGACAVVSNPAPVQPTSPVAPPPAQPTPVPVTPLPAQPEQASVLPILKDMSPLGETNDPEGDFAAFGFRLWDGGWKDSCIPPEGPKLLPKPLDFPVAYRPCNFGGGKGKSRPAQFAKFVGEKGEWVVLKFGPTIYGRFEAKPLAVQIAPTQPQPETAPESFSVTPTTAPIPSPGNFQEAGTAQRSKEGVIQRSYILERVSKHPKVGEFIAVEDATIVVFLGPETNNKMIVGIKKNTGVVELKDEVDPEFQPNLRNPQFEFELGEARPALLLPLIEKAAVDEVLTCSFSYILKTENDVGLPPQEQKIDQSATFTAIKPCNAPEECRYRLEFKGRGGSPVYSISLCRIKDCSSKDAAAKKAFDDFKSAVCK